MKNQFNFKDLLFPIFDKSQWDFREKIVPLVTDVEKLYIVEVYFKSNFVLKESMRVDTQDQSSVDYKKLTEGVFNILYKRIVNKLILAGMNNKLNTPK